MHCLILSFRAGSLQKWLRLRLSLEFAAATRDLFFRKPRNGLLGFLAHRRHRGKKRLLLPEAARLTGDDRNTCLKEGAKPIPHVIMVCEATCAQNAFSQ